MTEWHLCEHIGGRWPGSRANWDWYARHCAEMHPNGFAGPPPGVQKRRSEPLPVIPEEPLSPEDEEMMLF